MLIPKHGSKRGRKLKIVAKINLDKPLFRGSKIMHDGQVVWVELSMKVRPRSVFIMVK